MTPYYGRIDAEPVLILDVKYQPVPFWQDGKETSSLAPMAVVVWQKDRGYGRTAGEIEIVELRRVRANVERELVAHTGEGEPGG